MSIVAGSDILASDFISTSAGAGDSGKAPKLNASGKLDKTFPSIFGCRVYQNAGTSISSGGSAIIAFQAEDFDSDTMHDNATNNTRITFKTAGYYLVVATFYTTGTSSSAAMGGLLRLNGSTVIAGGGGSIQTAGVTVSTIRHFAVNDYIEFICTSPAGSISSDGNESTNFSAIMLQSG